MIRSNAEQTRVVDYHFDRCICEDPEKWEQNEAAISCRSKTHHYRIEKARIPDRAFRSVAIQSYLYFQPAEKHQQASVRLLDILVVLESVTNNTARQSS